MKNSRFTFFIFGLMLTYMVQAQQWGDYTLYSEIGSTAAQLLDTNGLVVKTWTFSPSAPTGYSNYLLPGGKLVRTVKDNNPAFVGFEGVFGRVQIVDWNNTILWDYVYSSPTSILHGDICPMPNGNILMTVYEKKSSTDADQAGGLLPFFSEKIIEVEPSGATGGNVVWEWRAWDHIVQDIMPDRNNYESSHSAHPERFNINTNPGEEWLMISGLDYNPILDQITFSSPKFSEMYVIDHSTTTAQATTEHGGMSGKGGGLLYRWGSSISYGVTGNVLLDDPYDAHWIPEGVPNAGRLVNLDNHCPVCGQSDVAQVTPPLSGYTYTSSPGQLYTPATYSSYKSTQGRALVMGNSQQLPNGNELICISNDSKIYEVNAAGAVLWTKQVHGKLAQALRYDQCYVSNAAPAIPTISRSGNQLTASAASNYQWYQNGVLIPGATAQSYMASQPGYYLVRINDANGCVPRYSASYNFNVTTGISGHDQSNQLHVYPNPVSNTVSIDAPFLQGQSYEVSLFDAQGRQILRKNDVASLDLSMLANGLYVLSLKTDKGEYAVRKLTVMH